ncbi:MULTISPECIES: DUF5053 domain-containing protein [Bacteroides]|jgi:hypothetical protein|uniref:DUF5053 domain-containing protein n=1 Tax=Bacteroides fragilis TaxID=817 RepID=A0A413JWZ8_BACFG|nr:MULTISPECIES: DUF5053 domain-containing protein [Bacteroides]MBU3043238.1 DUF5053 domain-containing protein [Bacteroides sp. HF-4919]MBY2893621.1 hypothetical protein [Bacteroides fragilis]MCM0223788.1 DUF5053 domain-containing protein [Bacteroides fragilis]MCM0300945.1 DUF5053 domain-containing protein [Bacteroides fragilis]MCM0361286.1 DUF5053 domain-containing protein [Bacteroides fragilis]
MEELKERIRACFEEFCTLKTEAERQEHDKKFATLMKSVPVEQRKLAGQYLREVMAERRTLKSQKINKNFKKELEDIENVVSLSYIAKEYFGKDRTWLYKKINGTIPFTEDEIKILSMALKSIGNRFLDTSASLT